MAADPPTSPSFNTSRMSFPYMKNFDGPGESATQAIYNNEWAPYRYTNGETTSWRIWTSFALTTSEASLTTVPLNLGFWNSEFSTLYAWDSIGTSSYNALQFTLRHPTSHGLTVDFSYTFSKYIGSGLGDRACQCVGSCR